MARIRGMGVRSPSKHASLKSLKAIRKENFFNPETGLELSAEETRTRIHELEEKKASRIVSKQIRNLNKRIRVTKSGRKFLPDSQIQRWVTIRKGEKLIRFPIKKSTAPFL